MPFTKVYDNQDPWYQAIQERPEDNADLLQHLNELWKVFSPYSDTNFESAFALDPFARYWEMSLAVRLLESGKALITSNQFKKNSPKPDICIAEDGIRIWIEAVCPTEGESETDGVRAPQNRTLGAVPVRQAMLRITQAITSKIEAFDGYIKHGLIEEKDIVLIAVNTGRYGYYTMDDDYPLIVKCIFPGKRPTDTPYQS